MLEDHYFGTLDRRILAFLQDCEWSLWKLGVPATTRHNEVAPSQYEMAPIYEHVSVACDHNLLMMEILKERARTHGMACLLHEKPFTGVNGSGKHNNWSIGTNEGENVMEPGQTPAQNAQFLVFLSAVIRAVSLHGDLLRIAVAVPGNDHRLGANEAPPAIMSVYVGDQLLEVVQDIVADPNTPSATKAPHRHGSKMQLGVSAIPHLPRDMSDRNRTSPFAFTGNKFEFRAVGSSQSCARPAMIVNTIMADSLHYVADQIDKLLKQGMKRDIAIQTVVTQVLKEHNRAVFNGNGYTEEWVKEAAKRGLFNLRTLPEAIQQLTSEKNIKLFESLQVLSRTELESQQHIAYENFSKVIAVESAVMLQMVSASVVPAVFEYKRRLKESIDDDDPLQVAHLKEVRQWLTALLSGIEELKKVKEQAEAFHEDKLFEQATFYRTQVVAAMEKTRSACDKLELLIDDQLWPFPKYSEILFLK
jgi:glutamine synthetase